MLKGFSIRLNSLEIIFWDGIFHCIKLLQKLQEAECLLTFHISQKHIRTLWILILLLNSGVAVGIFLSYLHNL